MRTVAQHIPAVGIVRALWTVLAPAEPLWHSPKELEGDVQGREHLSGAHTGRAELGRLQHCICSHVKRHCTLVKSAWHIPEQLLDKITSCQILAERAVT